MDEQWLIEQFRWLHRHPETGLQEHETTKYLADALRQNGIRLLDTGLPTGLIAVVGNQSGGPVAGLRCDIDALPIQEDTGLAYASENPGVMHACGHDFHAATMLGAALLLKAREDKLPGTVKIVFQPAEEIDRGGEMMTATGLLDDVQVFYGVHTYPAFEPGTLGIKTGTVMAAADRFSARILGRGAHAGYPSEGVDPIPALASAIQAAQSIVSRTVDPYDSAVVSITHVRAGNTWNVIPGEAFLEGTVRALTEQTREQVHQRLAQAVTNAAAAHGCRVEFEYLHGPDAVINDEGACERAERVARAMGLHVDRQAGCMSSEDFSDYLRLAPGAFIRVGTGGGQVAHHPRFTADPAALWPAAHYFAALAEEALKDLSQSAK